MRIVQGIFVLFCTALFIFFRARSHIHNHPPVSFTPSKPALPAPTVCINSSSLVDRVYLGETALGLPFFLDVRQFELKGVTSTELITWHLDLLEGPCEEIYISDQRKVYIRKGVRNAHRLDTTHGFAPLQGERALFLDCFQVGDRLFMCTAEAPWETFQKHEPFLRSLVKLEQTEERYRKE